MLSRAQSPRPSSRKWVCSAPIPGGRQPRSSDDYIDVYAVPAGATVIMATDGFPVVHPTLKASEQALKALITRDPAAIDELWPIGKPIKPGANAPDDRAYVRFNVR